MKISDLPEGLRQLAEKRRIDPEDPYVVGAFTWDETPEGQEFWWKVHIGDFSVYHGCKVTNLRPKLN